MVPVGEKYISVVFDPEIFVPWGKWKVNILRLSQNRCFILRWQSVVWGLLILLYIFFGRVIIFHFIALR